MRKFSSRFAPFWFVPLLIGCFAFAISTPSSAAEAKPTPPAAAPSQTAPPAAAKPAAPAQNAPPAAAKPATPAQNAPAPAKTKPAAPAKLAAPAQAQAPAVNAVTQAAVQAGVLVSASRINQVLAFLTTDTKSSAFLFLPQKDPNQSIFSVSLGLEIAQSTPRYASASFAPTANGQAGAVYDTVQYVAASLADVETKVFKNLKRKGTLGNAMVILDGGPMTVFLMPAGSGCVVIKKEVVQ